MIYEYKEPDTDLFISVEEAKKFCKDMIYEYKELHIHPDTDLFVSVEEAKKFCKDIDVNVHPVELKYLTTTNSPRVIVGYDFDQFYFNYKENEYVTLFEEIRKNGWRYVNTYFANGQKILTFIKTE